MALTVSGASLAETPEEEASLMQPPRKKPNILLIHADQHRIDCMGACGNPDVRTPRLDALARDGMRFGNSFCPYPICTPSRYSLLSGLYVHEHRGWTNQATLAPDIATFPRLLRAAGYRTKAVGKMHFTPTYLDVGFDEMVLAEQDGPGRWDDDYHRDLMRQGLADINDLEDQRSEYRSRARQEYWDTFGAMPSNLPEPWHTTPWVGDHCVQELEHWTGEGNLLMAGFVKPHHPFDPPASWYDAYDPDKLTVLPGWTPECFEHDLAMHRGFIPHEQLTEPVLRRVMACYYATIEQIDAQVGRMLDTLKRRGLYENTLIIYTSDHGEYLGFHHLMFKGNHLYDPLVKVPLIIKYPADSSLVDADMRRGVSVALVNNVDLAPTILGQAGIAPAAAMHGHNLALAPTGREIVFCELLRGNLVMARTDAHKLVLAQGQGQALFFDLETDPLEMNNRADDPACREKITELTRAIEAWRPFDPAPTAWLDEDAPVIAQPNVPPRDNSHREPIIAWYRDAWERLHPSGLHYSG